MPTRACKACEVLGLRRSDLCLPRSERPGTAGNLVAGPRSDPNPERARVTLSFNFTPSCLVYSEEVKVLASLAALLVISAWGQDAASRLPQFEDYPVKAVFRGIPVAPILTTPIERRYRTRIRQGVEKGWGVLRDGKASDAPGPNFAGNMIVVQWGCGAPCMMMAMVDAQTGVVRYPPMSFEGVGVHNFGLPLLTVGLAVSRNPDVEFRLDSRLMIVKATPKQSGQHPTYRSIFYGRRIAGAF